ncbi:isopenicillin N synthase family oxygenase [Rhodococcus sp. HNM0569]|uniref:isopenicillin N synthase family dioxygenase n=1 Tax=Rhodococcus sp. HNM0569 TaxID=2716340 RepID=UPI00146E8C62|nr:isopenicillin N synthase family oxygenase [Rhodococcus sp. HNM0569]NLU82171.1 isopenicillin N synthase family oxygenase [Rhodococcus sp. HNM0569]
MSAPVFSVPTVDIAPYVTGGDAAERAMAARSMDDACRTVGFVQVTGHGIPEVVTDALAAALDHFFALAPEVKARYRVEGANRGYSPPKSEALSLSAGIDAPARMNDFFEAFNVGVEARSFTHLELDEADYGRNVWPDEAGAAFRDPVETYFAEAARVARTLTTIFADALGVPVEFFDDLTGHSIDVLRMNNYALPPGTVVPGADLTGMGEHTDFGIVTVLWADRVAGLQVLGSDGEWHDVAPAPGALLVNLGDLTARLTNDRWMSTLHRVKPPLVDGTIVRRRSAAFFHDGNADAVIAPLPTCPPAAGRPYDPVTVREHIAAKLGGSRLGKLNTRADREAARLASAVPHVPVE